MATELSERFGRKQWKDCCGKGCGKCAIAQAYTSEFGRKKGLEILNEDRAEAKKGKGGKKRGGERKAAKGGGKKRDGKKRGGERKAAKGGGKRGKKARKG